MKRIAILASGNGTNAQRLIEHFRGNAHTGIALVGCDNPKASVIHRAWELGVPSYLFSGKELQDGAVLRELQDQRIDLIVLAGFLRLIPVELVRAFPKRIMNIHPALLPEYGGKGMYGDLVHQAVIAAGAKESGITIHYVNERYDEGEHIAQFRCPVLPGDDANSLADRIRTLEHQHYPIVVESLIMDIP